MNSEQNNEQFYKMKIEDLEKQLAVRNLKIDSLYKEIKFRTDELARQTEKNQIVCEARDENKFKVLQLERDVIVLRNQNDDLKSQLKEQNEIKNSKELEAVVASYVDQIKKYEEKLELCESKISQLETEKSASTSLLEKSLEKRCNSTITEDNIKILQLENDIKLLSLENEDLKLKLGEEKEGTNSRIHVLETHIESCAEKLQKSEKTIKEYESQMIYLETEKKAHLSQIKKLQAEVQSHQSLEEKITNAQLQKEVENLKSVCKKQNQAVITENAEITEITPQIESINRRVVECKNIFTSFAEQHRHLQMKFELEMIEKLQHLQEMTSFAEKENDISKVCNPVDQDTQRSKAGKLEELPETVEKPLPLKPQKKVQQKIVKSRTKDVEMVVQLAGATSQKELHEKLEKDYCPAGTPNNPENRKQQKPAKIEVKKLQENVEQDDNSVRSPLKPQNRRQQITAKTKVKDSESPETVKSSDANAVSQKKNTKKNKKKNENVYSPIEPKDSVSENIKTVAVDKSAVSNQGGRQLRTRRKV